MVKYFLHSVVTLLQSFMNMLGDSSSDDEITKRILKDSIDTELLTNDLYDNSGSKKLLDENNSKIKNAISVKSKPSLRYILDDDGHDHNFIKVTPEFQEFVAKNLSKHLENQILEKKTKRCFVNKTDNRPKGIYLFNGSTTLLNAVESDNSSIMKKQKPYHKKTSDKVILQQASEAAVSPEWILNKVAVQGWAKVTKGKILKVKSNKEGTFDVVSDEF